MSRPRRRTTLALLALIVPLAWLVPGLGAANAADPVLEQDTTVNGCNGVLPTPGSENTHKRLDPTYPSDFNPGGVVGYIVDFPVDPADFGDDFEITDCVYVDPPGAGADTAIAKYFVHFVPNNANFQLQFAVPIPANTPLGSQFCNYVKTTASPSASQASNRKAGPACFTVGGGLRIEKRSGSSTGPLLPGASFNVLCSPTTASPPTIITGLSNPSVVNPNTTVTAAGISADGTIAINGPSGTPCTVTETAAPAGYEVDPTPRILVIPVGTSQTINVFVNQQLGSLSVSKHTVGGGGTFHFTVSCDDGETYAPFDMTVAAGDTDTHLVSNSIVVGTECTVTETTNALFSTTSVPVNRTVTIDADGETVAFTNTRLTGALVVTKTSDVDATFHFDVDCNGTAFDTTLTITTAGGTGSASINGIPTGTSCTVTEQSNPQFSAVVNPVDGTVTISVGDNTVAFTNTRLRGDLVINKSSDVDGTFTFDVDCSDNVYDASNISITTVNGVGSASITGIPTGVTCTVSEDNNPAYSYVVVPADGTVTISVGNNPVGFTNTRLRGDLTINKSSDVDGTFTFDVDCSDDAYDQSNVSITTVNGVGSAAITDIPTGVTCTVTEDGDAHFATTVIPADGTVTIDVDGETVAFENLRIRGSLIVTKAITDATDSGPYDFTFHVTCGQLPEVTFHLGTAAGLSLVHQIDGIATDTVCTVTEDSDPTWSTTVTPTSGQVTITTTPATVAFANTKLFRQTSFVKSSDPASGTAVTDGATITYTLTYANAGNIPADVTITDTVPAGTTLVAGSAGDATVTGSKLTWERTIAAGGSGAVSFRVTVNAGLPDPTTIRNVALLHGDDGDTPSNEVVHPVAHVNISKVVDRDTAEFGDELTYTLFVSNPSAADLTDVVISDAIPSGTTFVSAASGGTCDNPCTRVTWPAVNLAAGDSTERTFVVRINRPVAAADGAIAAAVITNFGEVDPRETPKKPSNEVVTRVTAVLGIKIVKPPVVIPETGPAIPLQSAVLVALGLLVLGGTLTRTARRR